MEQVNLGERQRAGEKRHASGGGGRREQEGRRTSQARTDATSNLSPIGLVNLRPIAVSRQARGGVYCNGTTWCMLGCVILML